VLVSTNVISSNIGSVNNSECIGKALHAAREFTNLGGLIDFVRDAARQNGKLAAGKCSVGPQGGREWSVGRSAMTWTTGVGIPTSTVVELCEM
jgi:hypothetical protein